MTEPTGPANANPLTARWDIQIDVPAHVDVRDMINTAMAQFVEDLRDAVVRCEVTAFNAEGDAFNSWSTGSST